MCYITRKKIDNQTTNYSYDEILIDTIMKLIQNHETSYNEESEEKCNMKKEIIIMYKQGL